MSDVGVGKSLKMILEQHQVMKSAYVDVVVKEWLLSFS